MYVAWGNAGDADMAGDDVSLPAVQHAQEGAVLAGQQPAAPGAAPRGAHLIDPEVAMIWS